MKKLSRRTFGFITLAILLVLILVSLVIRFDYKISGPGRFAAQSEWTLVNSEQDKLQSNHFYNGLRSASTMELFHFTRPDFIQFNLAGNLQVGSMVSAGETVAQLMSSEDQMRLVALAGDLQETNANLTALRTGEKQALQDEANQALQYARAELAAYEPVLQRQKDLYTKKLTSDQMLEITQAQYDLYKINVSLQEARLKTAKTGEKAEAIAIIQAEVNSISSQLDIFRNKINASAIKSPISGVIIQPDRLLGELFHLCDIDTMILQMPVKAADIKYVEKGMRIRAVAVGSRQPALEMTVSGIDYNASVINYQPMYLVTAQAVNGDYSIRHGMTAHFAIYAGKTTLLDMIARAWEGFRFNK